MKISAKAFLLCIALMSVLCGCGGGESIEPDNAELAAEESVPKTVKSVTAEVLFEEGDGNNISAMANMKIPNTSFKIAADRGKITVKHGENAHEINGMPIVNAYFADITDDGVPDLCCTLLYGSGMIDSRVIVYDTQNDKEYELSEREKFDYSLCLDGDKLCAVKAPYDPSSQSTDGEKGNIAIEEDELAFIPVE